MASNQNGLKNRLGEHREMCSFSSQAVRGACPSSHGNTEHSKLFSDQRSLSAAKTGLFYISYRKVGHLQKHTIHKISYNNMKTVILKNGLHSV